MSQEHSDFSISSYLTEEDENDNLLDLNYLKDLDDVTFTRFFSLENFASKQQLYSPNYDRYYEYIYSGCSETMGEFLCQYSDNKLFSYSEVGPLIWGEMVKSSLGVDDSLNMGMGGASIMGIVISLFRQIRLHGAPKHLLVLLPNPETRITFVQDPANLISGNNPNKIISDIGAIGDNEHAYSKKPHLAEEVLSRRWMAYINIQHLLYLEDLCDSYGINLIYSTWSSATHRLISAANDLAQKNDYQVPFKNYIVFDYRKSGGTGGCKTAAKNMKKDCHLNVDNNPLWDLGRGGHHMGIHAHIHAAEIFNKEIVKRRVLGNL